MESEKVAPSGRWRAGGRDDPRRLPLPVRASVSEPVGGDHGVPFREVVDQARVDAYREATNDPATGSDDRFAPVVYGAVLSWEAAATIVNALAPDEQTVSSSVHLAQDMHLSAPVRVGTLVEGTAVLHGIRPTPLGTTLCVLVRGSEGADRLFEIYATVLVRGLSGLQRQGADPPDHSLARASKAAVAARFRLRTDPDQTYRYSKASGDVMPIHLDDAVARAVGLPGIILHGMCTMAFCAHGMVREFARGDVQRVRRLAVRFVRPVQPGQEITVSAYDLGAVEGRRAIGFEASSGGRVVIKDGRCVLEPR